MKTQRNILIAFLLNLGFSVFELVGGLLTGSVAIVSDALHDFGDAISIGVSWFLERKSKKDPDRAHSYGYSRYSVLGAAITNLILLFGSAVVVYNAVMRIIHPVPLNSDGMILLGILGAGMNLAAAWFTHGGDSLNEKAVNLHMLEDVLGWVVVLVGAIAIRFTDFVLIDPLMSIGVAVFIFINALQGMGAVLDVFLEKTPHGIDPEELAEHIQHIDHVVDVHHIHVWTMDGVNSYATLHVVAGDCDTAQLKQAIRDELAEHGIGHTTIELEKEGEHCHQRQCRPAMIQQSGHCHHHHHHHHGHKHGHKCNHDHHDHQCDHGHDHDHHDHKCDHDHHDHKCDHAHHEHQHH